MRGAKTAWNFVVVKPLIKEDAIMKAFGLLTLVVLMFMYLEIEIVSSDPCSQFSEPNRQVMCSSDNFPEFVANEED